MRFGIDYAAGGVRYWEYDDMVRMIRCLTEEEWIRLTLVIERIEGGVDMAPWYGGVKLNDVAWMQWCRDSLGVWMMGDAGLRVGELLKMRLSDVVVVGSAVRVLRVTSEVGKGGRARDVPTTNNLRIAIERYNKHIVKRYDHVEDPYLMGRGASWGVMGVRRVQVMVSRLGWIAIGRKITPHQLRHTFAVRLRRRVDLPVVQVLLGHAQLSSTQVYMGVSDDDVQHAIKSLSGSVGESRSRV